MTPLEPTTPSPTDAGRWGQIVTVSIAALGALFAVSKWAFDPLLDQLHKRRSNRAFPTELKSIKDSAIAIDRIEQVQGSIVRDVEHMRDSVELIPALHTLAKGNAEAIERMERTQERMADAITKLAVEVGEVRGTQREQSRGYTKP